MAKVIKEFRSNSIKTTLIFNGIEFSGVYCTTGKINKPEDLFDFEFKKRYDLNEEDENNHYEDFLESDYSKADVLGMIEVIEYSYDEIQEVLESLTEIEKGI